MVGESRHGGKNGRLLFTQGASAEEEAKDLSVVAEFPYIAGFVPESLLGDVLAKRPLPLAAKEGRRRKSGNYLPLDWQIAIFGWNTEHESVVLKKILRIGDCAVCRFWGRLQLGKGFLCEGLFDLQYLGNTAGFFNASFHLLS